jgi:hypothetical protein
MNVRVIPSQSNHIRAFAAANPGLTPRQIEARLGYDHRLVELALGKGDKRRPKSVLRVVK